MSLYNSMMISSSALSAQRIRLDLISSNLANTNTTRTAEGGPYQRKDVIFKASNLSFEDTLDNEIIAQTPGVTVESIYKDPRPFISRYEPNHPDADPAGYVSYPNINVIEEMVNMISSTRSYEANSSVIEAAKAMALRAIEIGA
jgi:flagellar basal-body rod protein FlgC